MRCPSNAWLRMIVTSFPLRGPGLSGSGLNLNSGDFSAFRSAECQSKSAIRRLERVRIEPGAIKSVRGSAIVYVLRYLIIGAAVYVIVKLLRISVMPVAAGLFVTAAAVMAEILYELVSSKQ